MLIFDAHLDLAMNALEWNRDYTQPLETIRQREAGLTDRPDRGRGTVCLPEMRRGRIGLCVATQIARYVKPGNPLPGWHSPEQAWAQTQGQRAWYRAMEAAGQMVSICARADLAKQATAWQSPASSPAPPIGYLLSLEGADSLVTIGHLERAYRSGLRAVGPAHYGPGRYCAGTEANGGFTESGRELLKEMDRLTMILDVSHLTDEAFWEAMDSYQGPIWASHSNCRALVPHGRQLNDDQIKALIDRKAVIGCALDAWMMVAGWVRGKTSPVETGLELDWIVEHMDHICQLAGNAQHVGIGSDLDGAFGCEQTPGDLQSIADLAKLPRLLAGQGFTEENIRAIMHGNFLRFLEAALPV